MDDFIPNTKNKTWAECVTENQLPVPQSQTEIDAVKNKLDTEITKTTMSKKTRSRLKLRRKGLKYREIAEKEGVGVATVRKSVNRGILQIQKEATIYI